MKTSNKAFPTVLIFAFLMSVQSISNPTDTITATQILRDGETIVSSDETYELGFFSPGKSKNRYVGMWYKKVAVMKTVAWVANREAPLTSITGVLKLIKPGRLVLLNDTNGATIWSTNTSRPVNNPVAKLLDSGNFVVKDANDDNPDNFVWESFDHPTDTLFPGMKFGWKNRTGQEVYLVSWKSDDDPSFGDYTYRYDPVGYPQQVLKEGATVWYKTGPWNGIRYSGLPNLRKNQIYNYGFVFNKNEAYYFFELLDKSAILRLTLRGNPVLIPQIWTNPTQGWVFDYTSPTDDCDTYGLCGANGICRIANSPVCECLDRFTPKDPDRWVNHHWSNGCVRRTPLDCQKGDAFIKYSSVKLPDTHTTTQSSWYNESMTIDECEVLCLRNCSCMAYSSLDIRGSGCLLWFEDLINIRELADGGEDIYIRMASFELHSIRKKRIILEVSLSLSLGVVLFGLTLMLYFCRRKNQRLRIGTLDKDFTDNKNGENSDEDMELPIFDLNTIIKATDNFSIDNKLGEGGFGPVYKGVLEKGQEIAVKRLSRKSLQGLEEFKNEVKCIAKVQHRNLVKLLGCCIEREEKMLIYEYMHNKSLDFILFDPMQSAVLDWPKRFHIMNNIARGLMYLHQDSHLRIIHRDLKVSNILLDSDMNPKISDFGMARSFGGNETGANTSRVVGTYGYMSPEYAIDGLFSLKSDVFSFGVIVLEIVSGKRNRGFSHEEHHHNLLGHAWMLYKEGRSLEIVDPYLSVSNYSSQVLRAIHVGLLCVQKCPEDRPRMSSVLFMFENEGELPQARRPGFFTERDLFMAESSSSSNVATSVNQMSVTIMEAR